MGHFLPTGSREDPQVSTLKLIKEQRYRHPFYWAGFVIIGNGT